jgi:hypothetical protein
MSVTSKSTLPDTRSLGIPAADTSDSASDQRSQHTEGLSKKQDVANINAVLIEFARAFGRSAAASDWARAVATLGNDEADRENDSAKTQTGDVE